MDLGCTDLKRESKTAADSEPDAARSSTRLTLLGWIVLSMLALSMLVQMWASIRQLSVTSDEIDHLHAGYRYLQCGDFGWNPEHPPLVKMVAALPLLGMHVNDPVANACGLTTSRELDFRYGHIFTFANPQSMLLMARMAASIFAIMLLIATYLFARELFDVQVAMFAAAMVAFEPNLLGHGSLVTTDVAAAFGYLLATFALWRYLKQPTILRACALGVAIGLALATKYSTLVLIVLLPLLTVLLGLVTKTDGGKRGISPRLSGIAAAMLIAIGVLWACYGFRYAARPNAAPAWSNDGSSLAHGVLATKVIPSIENFRLLPQAYLAGLQDVTIGSELGRPAFLLGQDYLGGRWYYFPTAALIKSTVALLLSVFLSFAAHKYWRERRRELLFLWGPVLIFMLASANSGMNIGIRHVFPVLPFLAIFGAAGIWNLKWNRTAVRATVAILVLANIVTCLRAFPDYISYANELWGGPGNVYKYLADSNADWGQAQIAARNYIEQTKATPCITIRTYYSANADYGIPCEDISPMNKRILPRYFSGTIVVSSSVVDGIANGVDDAFAWSRINCARMFKGLKPKATIGGSALLVYEGTFDLSPIIADQYVARIGKTGDIHEPAAVAQQAKLALEIDPSNLLGRYRLCQAYAYLGNFEGAKAECPTVYQMMQSNPYVSPAEKGDFLRSLIANGMMPPSTLVP